MSKPDRSRVLRLAEAQSRIPGPAGEHAVSILQRGTLNVALSLPVPPNQQSPHTQDEDFAEDLAVWRVFYGPLGGEVAA